ncbi:argininosuccinate synthetase [Suillus ampliporus]|nr:argininosuccinate synthetase [Suillus ampliporus]
MSPPAQGRVLLAYSGGLGKSIHEYEVYAFMADVGQEEVLTSTKKALDVGAKKFFLEREFVIQLIYPAVQANCIYENVYLLGTSLARPVIARGMMSIANKAGCDYVSHGCTGKGNDQVRFELAFYGLKPDINVIAPWRLPEFYNRFPGRQALLAYAVEKQIPVQQTAAKPCWSSRKGCANQAPLTDPADIFLTLNAVARKHCVGRVDIAENRFSGVKSRGCYESPGATILRVAHMDIEGLTLDRNVRALRNQFREFVTSAIPASQRTVNGTVRLKLFKGNVVVIGRYSDEGLYDEHQSSMDELGGFEPTDATGFIQIEKHPLYLPSSTWGQANARKGQAGIEPKDVYDSRI